MVMSYEKGINFSERLKKGQPSEEELTDMVLGLLDGLESMHAEGFIHRDIKPGNIYLSVQTGRHCYWILDRCVRR